MPIHCFGANQKDGLRKCGQEIFRCSFVACGYGYVFLFDGFLVAICRDPYAQTGFEGAGFDRYDVLRDSPGVDQIRLQSRGHMSLQNALGARANIGHGREANKVPPSPVFEVAHLNVVRVRRHGRQLSPRPPVGRVVGAQRGEGRRRRRRRRHPRRPRQRRDGRAEGGRCGGQSGR